MEKIINVLSLTKSFGPLELFINTSIDIYYNSVTAISGKNSSGKTTFLKLLSGLLLPDNGKIMIYEKDITKNRTYAKQFVSLALNTEYGFYPQLTLKENLLFLCKIYKKPFDDILIFVDILNIQNFLNNTFSLCSSGIKTKFWLVSSLVKNTKILLIDELTKSVDFDTRQKVYELIKELKTKFKYTIVFVSHDSNEINLLCDHWIKIEEHKFVQIR